METTTFIDNYREAFGGQAELPLVFWYSDEPLAEQGKINGCFFKGLQQAREGLPLSLSVNTISCGGGKLYTGFADMSPHIPTFVSLKERYKQTPEDVILYVESLQIQKAEKPYLNFLRIDRVDSLEGKEGVFFLATPDMLSGLATWAYFDNNDESAVAAPFGSGCASVVTQAVNENRRGGRRTFLGFFDPSVRPYVEANVLSYVIPMSRFREMYATMRQSCLFDTHAWGKIKTRINEPDTAAV